MRPQPPAPPSPQAPGLGDYLKAAFTWRWNLLGLFAGGAFALLSPSPARAAIALRPNGLSDR
jgi:hypothetical protein